MKNILFFVLLLFTVASCSKSGSRIPVTKPGNKVLILGNSITYSPANPPFGWNCSCGMAASAPDSDYVHLLTVRIKLADKSATVAAKNIAEFERNFDTYDLADSLKPFRDAKPDIIILRIGENVTRNADSVLFEQKYAELINYFKADNPSVKILAAGSVWPERDMANHVMSRHSAFISLISLQKDLSNFAFGLFSDTGIQNHPDNKGMKSISDQLWVEVEKLL